MKKLIDRLFYWLGYIPFKKTDAHLVEINKIRYLIDKIEANCIVDCYDPIKKGYNSSKLALFRVHLASQICSSANDFIEFSEIEERGRIRLHARIFVLRKKV